MAILYRAMTLDPTDGLPTVGPSARKLGIRGLEQAPNEDVPVESPDDIILPGTGGMSVAPTDPLNLDRRRRPAALGGTGKDPVWVIDEAALGSDIQFRQDTDRHGVVEPIRPMTRAEFEQALAATRRTWTLYTG
jgi:hypothetical protein